MHSPPKPHTHTQKQTDQRKNIKWISNLMLVVNLDWASLVKNEYLAASGISL